MLAIVIQLFLEAVLKTSLLAGLLLQLKILFYILLKQVFFGFDFSLFNRLYSEAVTIF